MSGADKSLSLGEPIGSIVRVHGPVVDIECQRLPPLNRALQCAVADDVYQFEVHQHLDSSHLRAIALHRTDGLSRGTDVFDTGKALSVPVTRACLGRLLDIFGDDIRYYASLRSEFAASYYRDDIQRRLSYIDRLQEVASDYGQQELADRAKSILSLYSGR